MPLNILENDSSFGLRLETACLNQRILWVTLLTAFEQMFGLKINFHKNKLFYYGSAKACET